MSLGAGGAWEALPETALATTGMEVATFGEAALATGLEVGGTVGAACGFEIPVWGWIATGVAVAGGVGYGIYKHYKNQEQADTAARKQGFKSSAEVLDAAKAGFTNARELRFVDEQIRKAGLGNDLADYAQKHGHASLEDFMKTAALGSATNGHLFAQSWGYKTAAETAASQQQQTSDTSNTVVDKPKPVQHTVKPVTQDEVLRLQKALGIDEAHQTGQWDKDTNDAVGRLVVRAQLTDACAQAGGTVEGKYGPKTEAGLKSLVAEGKISEEAANAVMSIGAARLHQVYRPPHDVDAVVHQVNFQNSLTPPVVKPAAVAKFDAGPAPELPSVDTTPPPSDIGFSSSLPTAGNRLPTV